MRASAWVADDWEFWLFDVKCKCGWYLADAEPVMGRNGVAGAEGICKRHGKVAAETWDLCDLEPAE
jgi:hypothetical protein